MKTLLYLLITSATMAQTQRDVPYGPHERHKLDFWRATADKPTPLLVFIHGGGWAGGDKADVPAKLVSTMLKSGISVASISYRFTRMAILPAPQKDAASAVQFLRRKAGNWNIHADRIAAYGISAGGCSALWLALHDEMAAKGEPSTRLCAAVGLSPQTCLEPAIVTGWIGDQVLAHAMISRAVQAKKLEDMKHPTHEWVKLLHEASPITHVSADDPPLLIQNPRVDPLPATSAGSAIHHAIFGVKLKERCDAVGSTCILSIQDKPDAAVPTPEAFLIEQLTKK